MLNTLEKHTLDFSQFEKLRDFSKRLEKFGVDLYVYDSSMNLIHENISPDHYSRDEHVSGFAQEMLAFKSTDPEVRNNGNDLLAVNLFSDDEPIAVMVLDAGFGGQDYDSSNNSDEKVRLFEELLYSVAENIQQINKSSAQIEMISGELAQTYEELVLLYKMSVNMKVSQSEATYLQLACDNVTNLVNVEGIAILLEKEVEGQNQMVITAGSGLISVDRQFADTLEVALQEQIAKGADVLLDSDFESAMKYNWPQTIKNIVAVPLNGSDRMMGIMVAVNRVDKTDFDSIDAKLFNTVAHECAVFIENGRLFKDLKELFMGALKALTNSIDAKDQYTRGHSERVAFISRWIAEKLVEGGHAQLDEEDIHKIYLAGLLHDIGKIGIDEKVLKKQGALEDDEWKQIRSHPSIGASILTDIKQMKQIIPGILHHHERIDGRGYPAGLNDKEIPLIAKIINVADSFDAMISKRVYRDALSIGRAVSEIEKGLGKQFDETVGQVFIDSDLKLLWDTIQDGFIERWDYSNFSEFGADAVGTLLR